MSIKLDETADKELRELMRTSNDGYIPYVDINPETGILELNPDEERNIANPELMGKYYLDRDIYHRTDVEQEDGTFKNEIRLFTMRGSFLSKEMYKEALELEEKYAELNTGNKITAPRANRVDFLLDVYK